MTETVSEGQVRTIVIPRALEDFFVDRLKARYAQRDDVRIIVDRRHNDRRNGDISDGAVSSPEASERRVSERRVLAGWWSLPDLPCDTTPL